MADFKKVMDVVFSNEGGYINDPNDPGGETNFGICKRSYPSVNIKELTKDMASEIYRKDYWNKIRGDDIADQKIALLIMDFAVNAGVSTAARLLQEILGVKKDGIIGPKTLAALSQTNSWDFVFQYAIGRLDFYVHLVNDKSVLIKFWGNWSKRIRDCVKR